MNELGDFLLTLSWCLSVIGLGAGLWSGYKKDARFLELSRTATILCFVSGLASILLLAYQFINSDYTNRYVWGHSNNDMPWYYKITAIWGGMDGSMLLWCVFLTAVITPVAIRAWDYPLRLIPYTLAAANFTSLFFLSVVTFLTNPFRYIVASFIPADGNGLNPLLQNPLMVIHPPMLYAGFTTFAVPFAFAFGALLSGKLDNEWIRLTRRWTLLAWSFLTAGIVLGGSWAYVELGWGGFWAWDPVENASFLPWLTGTAFLHSVMVQERKGMLKMWNVWLIILTYGLTVFGTFLTRSGIVQSVHAFASTDVGWTFLWYLGALFVIGVALTLYRLKELKSERKLESLLSREAFFLMNNLVFLCIMFATIWGVLFPVLSEAITGEKQTVSIPFFNAVNVPLFLFLIFLMGTGPLIAWRKASLSSLVKTFFRPLLGAAILGIILLALGIEGFYTLLSYSLCWFVLATIFGELHRGIAAQRASQAMSLPESAQRLFRRHRSRYGGYLVHLGVVIVTIGITASMSHKIEKEFTLSPDKTYEIGRYTLQLQGLTEERRPNHQAFTADVRVTETRTGDYLGNLKPELRRYFKGDMTTTEVALRVSPKDDLYLIVTGSSDQNSVTSFKAFVNPLQVWLWFGACIMVFGTLFVLIPNWGEERSKALALALKGRRLAGEGA